MDGLRCIYRTLHVQRDQCSLRHTSHGSRRRIPNVDTQKLRHNNTKLLPPRMELITTMDWPILGFLNFTLSCSTHHRRQRPPNSLDFNVSLSDLNSITGSPSIKSAFLDNMVIIESGTYPSGGNNIFSSASQTPYTYSAYAIKQTQGGTIGNQLWKNTLNPPADNLTVSYSGADPKANNGAGAFAEYYTETMQYVGYSMATGQKIWGPTESMAALAFFNSGYSGQGPTVAYGRIYSGGYSGVVYCYNMDDGKLLWTYGNGGRRQQHKRRLRNSTSIPNIHLRHRQRRSLHLHNRTHNQHTNLQRRISPRIKRNHRRRNLDTFQRQQRRHRIRRNGRRLQHLLQRLRSTNIHRWQRRKQNHSFSTTRSPIFRSTRSDFRNSHRHLRRYNTDRASSKTRQRRRMRFRRKHDRLDGIRIPGPTITNQLHRR